MTIPINMLCIAVGACIMLLCIFQMKVIKESIRVIHTVDQRKIKYHFLVYKYLIVLFFCGYMGILISFIMDYHIFNEMMFSLILLFGAIFVFLSKTLHCQLLKKINEVVEHFLPICCVCKKIRTNNDKPKDILSWSNMESYLQINNNIKFSHTYCPECYEKAIKDM